MIAKFDELLRLFGQYDLPLNPDGAVSDQTEPLRGALDEYFTTRETVCAVLGIDIYRYSQLNHDRQRLVPAIFALLYGVTVRLARERETFLFQEESCQDRFISTGDGGYQIVSTPLHALVFALYFELALSAFNAYFHYPRLRRFVGPLSVRYAITFDTIFQQDDNFYGRAIINNARIPCAGHT